MRVNSRVAERLKTYHPRKLGNNSKILQAHGIIAQRPAPPPPQNEPQPPKSRNRTPPAVPHPTRKSELFSQDAQS